MSESVGFVSAYHSKVCSIQLSSRLFWVGRLCVAINALIAVITNQVLNNCVSVFIVFQDHFMVSYLLTVQTVLQLCTRHLRAPFFRLTTGLAG